MAVLRRSVACVTLSVSLKAREAGRSLAPKAGQEKQGSRIKERRMLARDPDRQAKTFCRDQCKEVTRMASAEIDRDRIRRSFLGCDTLESNMASWALQRTRQASRASGLGEWGNPAQSVEQLRSNDVKTTRCPLGAQQNRFADAQRPAAEPMALGAGWDH